MTTIQEEIDKAFGELELRLIEAYHRDRWYFKVLGAPRLTSKDKAIFSNGFMNGWESGIDYAINKLKE